MLSPLLQNEIYYHIWQLKINIVNTVFFKYFRIYNTNDGRQRFLTYVSDGPVFHVYWLNFRILTGFDPDYGRNYEEDGFYDPSDDDSFINNFKLANRQPLIKLPPNYFHQSIENID